MKLETKLTLIAGVVLVIFLYTLANYFLAAKAGTLLSALEAEAPATEHRFEVSDVQVDGFTRICVLTDRITGAQYVCWSDYRGAAMARLPEKGEGMTYLYRCAQCGEFEAVQRITAKPLRRCPDCGGRVKRVVSGGAGFRLKGSGWTSPGRV